uniref:rRNA biogenesis protein RRP36 n=1 Tax=Parascaris univalens TaxID=6257 RepID=A0A915C9D0_PARUN
MEHELNGIKRTFPKKKYGGKNALKQVFLKKSRKDRGNRDAASISVDPTEGATLRAMRKVKKGSKARRRSRAAKFAAKIEMKKKAVEKHDDNEPDQEVSNEMAEREAGEMDKSSRIPFVNSTSGDDDSTDGEESEENIIDDRKTEKEDEADEMNSENEAVDDRESFRREIANMPMAKVKQLKERIGMKLFNKAFFGEMTEHDTTKKPIAETTKNSFIRDNPKRPREISSKHPVSKFRNVYANERIEKTRFDPRFDERCGPYDEYIHRTNYAFLNEMRQNEKKMLEKEIQKSKREDPERAQRAKEILRRMNNREKSLAEKERYKEVLREVRRENNERLRQGKKAVFLRRAELKMRVMEKKFEELKKTNTLDRYLEKKAKKQNRKADRPVCHAN